MYLNGSKLYGESYQISSKCFHLVPTRRIGLVEDRVSTDGSKSPFQVRPLSWSGKKLTI